jgi:hypothetical protein
LNNADKVRRSRRDGLTLLQLVVWHFGSSAIAGEVHKLLLEKGLERMGAAV